MTSIHSHINLGWLYNLRFDYSKNFSSFTWLHIVLTALQLIKSKKEADIIEDIRNLCGLKREYYQNHAYGNTNIQSHICKTFFKFQVCITNVHIGYDFILSNSLNSPNLYINWATMWYPDYQNKKLNFCMLNSFIYA